MNGPALLLVVAAVFFLLWEAIGVRHRRWVMPLGLACFAAAYMLQQVLQGMHQYAVR